MKEKEIYNTYQEFSVKCSERSERLSWAFVIAMAGSLMSGHTYQTFMVCGLLGLVSLLLGALQSLWQTVTVWLFKQRIRRIRTRLGLSEEFDFSDITDYPDYVGLGAWVFFILKMAAVSAAVLYFAAEVL